MFRLPFRAPRCFRLVLVGAGAFAVGASLSRPLAAQELPRALGTRALRLVDTKYRPIEGNCRDAHWNGKGTGVFFTLEANGTRNLWRAFPDPNDRQRYASWLAAPITRFKAPQSAARPVPLPGDRQLLCLQSETGDSPRLARFDLATGKLETLVPGSDVPDDPALTPDGNHFSFTGRLGRERAVYFLANPPSDRPRLVAALARRATWLDNTTLLYESTNSDGPGLYQQKIEPQAQPELVLRGGGEPMALPGGLGAVFAASAAAGEPTRLYLVARDGSGLRVLKGTEGARRPALSPQNSIVYDAPLEADAPRTLWLLELETRTAALASAFRPSLCRATKVAALRRLPRRVSFCEETTFERFNLSGAIACHTGAIETVFSTADFAPRRAASPLVRLVADGNEENPVAALLGVRRALLSSSRIDEENSTSTEGLAILGTLGGTPAQVTLEVGAGHSPSRWMAIPVAAENASRAPIALWVPPRGAKGTWTLRLTVTNRRGAAQSLWRVQLPLPRPIEPTPAPTPTPLPATTSPVDRLPLPPPAPLPRATPTPAPTPAPMRPAPQPVPFGGLPPFPTPPPAPGQTALPPRPPSPIVTPAPPPVRPRPRPIATPAPTPTLPPVDAPPAVFSGTFNVSGTLAMMGTRQKTRVTFWGLNRGNVSWQSGDKSTPRVRIVARWVDFSTGTRRQWNVVWLKKSVTPGQRATWDFDLEAPSRPGKYKLIYGLVRWPDDDNFTPPPYNAPQAAWMGEFAAIAFAINIVPRSAP